MGFDLDGKVRGTYFHASIHSWPVILGFTRHACPDAVDDATWEGMAYNDGQRVCAGAATRMADGVEHALMAAGTYKRFVLKTDTERAVDVMCRELFGRRFDNVADRDHLEHWVEFLRGCGGFEVN